MDRAKTSRQDWMAIRGVVGMRNHEVRSQPSCKGRSGSSAQHSGQSEMMDDTLWRIRVSLRGFLHHAKLHTSQHSLDTFTILSEVYTMCIDYDIGSCIVVPPPDA
jgi:hypothetical protein